MSESQYFKNYKTTTAIRAEGSLNNFFAHLGAVSIPEPVYQAHELAKRGSNNFKKFKENVPRVGDTHLIDCGQLTRLLSYGTNALVDTRFTA